MNYTDEQYALMDRLYDGIYSCDLSACELDILIYLDSKGIAQPRADICDGLWRLSQEGERVLAAHHAELTAKAEMAEQAAANKAEQKADKRRDRAFQVFLVFLGFILGLLADNIVAIVGFLVEYFSNG